MGNVIEEGRPNKGAGGVRRLIILAALVVGVAALVVLLTVVRNREPQIPEADPTPGKPEISRIDIERIAAVSLTGPGREQPFNMQRTESGWQIEGAASGIPIKESRIKDMLYSFSSLYAERVIEEDAADLEQYGLDPPAVVAVATLDDGSSIEVHLGDRTPAGNTWYLGLPGQRIVYAVWTNHGNHYYYTVADMRGDELPAINGEALNYLRLQGPAIATLEIVPGGDPAVRVSARHRQRGVRQRASRGGGTAHRPHRERRSGSGRRLRARAAALRGAGARRRGRRGGATVR